MAMSTKWFEPCALNNEMRQVFQKLLKEENIVKNVESMLFISVSGSQLYNTQIKEKSKDLDIVAVYVSPIQSSLSLFPQEHGVGQTMTNNQNQWKQSLEIQQLGVDYYFYELSKFCVMLLDSNPTGVELLFGCNDYASQYMCDTKYWLQILEMKKYFITKKLQRRYEGYCKQQLALATKKYDYGEENASIKALYTSYRVGSEAYRLSKGLEPKVCWTFDKQKGTSVKCQIISSEIAPKDEEISDGNHKQNNKQSNDEKNDDNNNDNSNDNDRQDREHYEMMMKIRKREIGFNAAVQGINLLLKEIDNEKKSNPMYKQLPDEITDETKQKLNDWVVRVRLQLGYKEFQNSLK